MLQTIIHDTQFRQCFMTTKLSEARVLSTYSLVQQTVPKSLSMKEIQDETASDHELAPLMMMIQTGSRRAFKKHGKLRKYWQVFPELSIVRGMVMRGDRIVIPEALQSRVIDISHEGHMGIVKIKKNCSDPRYGSPASTKPLKTQ